MLLLFAFYFTDKFSSQPTCAESGDQSLASFTFGFCFFLMIVLIEFPSYNFIQFQHVFDYNFSIKAEQKLHWLLQHFCYICDLQNCFPHST